MEVQILSGLLEVYMKTLFLVLSLLFSTCPHDDNYVITKGEDKYYTEGPYQDFDKEVYFINARTRKGTWLEKPVVIEKLN